MEKSKIAPFVQSSGFARKLTYAFVAVIATVALTIPVALYSFHQIQQSSAKATATAATLDKISAIDKQIAVLQTAAQFDALRPNQQSRNIMDADFNVLDANAHSMVKQIGLPQSESNEWTELIHQSSVALQAFETSVATGNDPNAAKTFNAKMTTILKQADTLTGNVSDRGRAARQEITDQIRLSLALLLVVLASALMLASFLAWLIPRRLMTRIDRIGVAAHQLARGDLSVRITANGSDELAELSNDFNTMARALEHRQQENQVLQQQLHGALLTEQERATRDPLTSLRNHRYFQESLAAEIDRCSRTGSRVSIAVIDLDNFKSVNDRFGHQEGDAVLLRTTQALSQNVRPYDLVCRLGGEEFGVIFPETDSDDAKMVLDRIAGFVAPGGANGERQTFSAGVATFPVHSKQQAELYQLADEAAYTAKANGKAQTVIYDPTRVVAMDSAERVRQRSRDAVLSTAVTLVSAVDQKDPYTVNHSELTAIYAATLARALEFDDDAVKQIYRAGLLHDVGKIGVNERILHKPGRLTEAEYAEVKQHPEFSYRILETGDLEPIATWVRHHHEHWNGSGYPFGLSANNIPIGSRIVLIADAFEAMTSDRVYRRALSIEQAIGELRTCAGTQFDPQIVPVMVDLVLRGVFTQTMQQYGRSIVLPAEAAAYANQPAPAAYDAAEGRPAEQRAA